MLFGKAAVGLFFLLSGYLVGGQVLRQCHAGTFSPRLYLINRFSRLWFVLATGMLLTAFLDFISRRIFPDFNGTGFAAASQGRGTSSLSYFVCNLGFLQVGRCPAYGSNLPLWSIGYEWYFYLVFPAMVIGVGALFRSRLKILLVSVSIIAASLMLFGIQLLWLMPAWLFGAGIAELQRRFSVQIRPILERKGVLTLCLVLTLLGFLLSRAIARTDPSIFLIVGILGAPLILVLGVTDPTSKNIFGRVVAQVARVGSWPYTLYIFHMPLLFFMGIAWASFALPANPLVAYGLFFAVLPIAYMFYSLVEARTPQIRAFLVKVTEVRN